MWFSFNSWTLLAYHGYATSKVSVNVTFLYPTICCETKEFSFVSIHKNFGYYICQEPVSLSSRNIDPKICIWSIFHVVYRFNVLLCLVFVAAGLQNFTILLNLWIQSGLDAPNPTTWMFLISSCNYPCRIHWSQVLSWEWRCSWSSADRRSTISLPIKVRPI